MPRTGWLCAHEFSLDGAEGGFVSSDALMGWKLRFISELGVERNPLNQTSPLLGVCLYLNRLGFIGKPWPYTVFVRSAVRAKQAYLLDWRVVMRGVEIARTV